MHYYQFNIGDYSSHTSRLTLLEDIAFRRLLDLYYLTERPFNGCSTDVARDIGMLNQQGEVDYILDKYFTKKGDFWINKRCDMEINLYKIKKKSASEAGKASAKARKHKASERTFNEYSTDVQPNINHKPLTINQVKEIKEKINYEIGFEDFWKVFHNGNKQRAVRAWVKAMKSHNEKTITREQLASNIIYATSGRLKSDPQWQNPKYRPHGSTYLNSKGWEDNWQDSAEEQIDYENTQRPTTAFEQSQSISRKIREDYQTSFDAVNRQREQGEVVEEEDNPGSGLPY